MADTKSARIPRFPTAVTLRFSGQARRRAVRRKQPIKIKLQKVSRIVVAHFLKHTRQ